MESPAFPAALLDALPFAAAVIDRRREVVAANPLFEGQLGGQAGPGASWLTALEIHGPTGELRAALHRLVQHVEEQTATIQFPADGGARWQVHLRRYKNGSEEQVLLVFEPAVDSEPLRARLHELEVRIDALRKMKHEVSNPLMGLVGHAELLASDPSLAPEPKRKAWTILEQARRMCDHIAETNRPPD